MDASVLAAIARWPNVPAVYGWLRLTARGEWRLRGEPIANRAINEFIGRNYARDERGCWYFQNGPQRVYVALELAPWVYRFDGAGALRTHTGARPAQLLSAALVDGETFVLQTELGAGNVDDRDIDRFLPALAGEDGGRLDARDLEERLARGEPACVMAPHCGLAGTLLPLRRCGARDLGRLFGFEAQPAPD